MTLLFWGLCTSRACTGGIVPDPFPQKVVELHKTKTDIRTHIHVCVYVHMCVHIYICTHTHM